MSGSIEQWINDNYKRFSNTTDLYDAGAKETSFTRKSIKCQTSKMGITNLLDKKVLSDENSGKECSTKVESAFEENKGTIITRSLDIKTLDQALKVSKVDLKVWEVDRFTINSWEVTMKIRQVINTPDKPKTFTNYQVKVWLKRKIVLPVDQAINSIVEKLANNKFKFKVPVLKKSKDNCMQEISLFDHHFGMLAWRYETGNDYDIKIAKELYINAVVDLLDKTNAFDVDHILFPIGQDFLHVNNPESMTPKNRNMLDSDGRLAKIFDAGFDSCIKAIDYCQKKAPVEVLWVPGNHDPETSYFLCKVLHAYYHNAKHVTIDVSPKKRKYKKYGVNLIGFTHGDEEPHRDLPTIMAGECAKEWSDSQFREWHLGHNHKRKETKYIAGDTFGGVGVRILPSLSGIDAWHFKKGYVKTTRAAESYIYSYKDGYIGHFSSNKISLVNKNKKLKGNIGEIM